MIAKLSRLSSINKLTEACTSIIMEMLNFVRISFSGLDDLTHLKMKSINMQYSMLYGVNMQNCVFKDVNFIGSIMDESNLSKAVSIGSSFSTFKTHFLTKKNELKAKIDFSLDEQYLVIKNLNEIIVYGFQQF